MNFSDLIQTWQLDRTSNTSRLLPHLTADHFQPNNFDVMKVKLAFQLISRRTAAAIRTLGTTGSLKSETWETSASFIEKLDKVIDACNSYYINTLEKQKHPLSDRNPEIEKLLTDFLDECKNWHIQYSIVNKKTGQVKRHSIELIIF